MISDPGMFVQDEDEFMLLEVGDICRCKLFMHLKGYSIG